MYITYVHASYVYIYTSEMYSCSTMTWQWFLAVNEIICVFTQLSALQSIHMQACVTVLIETNLQHSVVTNDPISDQPWPWMWLCGSQSALLHVVVWFNLLIHTLTRATLKCCPIYWAWLLVSLYLLHGFSCHWLILIGSVVHLLSYKVEPLY